MMFLMFCFDRYPLTSSYYVTYDFIVYSYTNYLTYITSFLLYFWLSTYFSVLQSQPLPMLLLFFYQIFLLWLTS
ncbi:hypothetical protein F4810DRAFT_667365 [Camillea tinctor]|nr:hypothetical protein F4810DRAFT_667365 [Camillea tinctor]